MICWGGTARTGQPCRANGPLRIPANTGYGMKKVRKSAQIGRSLFDFPTIPPRSGVALRTNGLCLQK